jgi:hypothetical protein
MRGGAGDEFCSREHRNQYRLRQGMERLAEANQVASVVRRRENPRQIPPEQLRSHGNDTPRGFLESRRVSANPGAFRVPHLTPAAAALPATTRFLQPLADGSPAAIELPAPPLSVRGVVPATAPRAALTAHVAPAPPMQLRARIAAVSSGRRAAVAPRRKPSPREFRGQLKAISTLDAGRPRKVATPVKGRALRVSMAAGFRVPEWKLGATSAARPEIAGMQWPGARPVTAAATSAAEPMASAIAVAEPELRIPAAPPLAFSGRFRWPGAIAVSIEFTDIANGQRTAFVPFSNPEERR